MRDWQPDAIAISCNYLANVPEVIELAKTAPGPGRERSCSSAAIARRS